MLVFFIHFPIHIFSASLLYASIFHWVKNILITFFVLFFFVVFHNVFLVFQRDGFQWEPRVCEQRQKDEKFLWFIQLCGTFSYASSLWHTPSGRRKIVHSNHQRSLNFTVNMKNGFSHFQRFSTIQCCVTCVWVCCVCVSLESIIILLVLREITTTWFIFICWIYFVLYINFLFVPKWDFLNVFPSTSFPSYVFIVSWTRLSAAEVEI